MEESYDKPSFLIYKHDYNSVKHLSNEDLGLLFRTIGEYQNDKTANIKVPPSIQQSFQFFKTRFDFDDKKYEKRVNANRLNASKNKKNKLINSEPVPVESNGNSWRQI